MADFENASVHDSNSESEAESEKADSEDKGKHIPQYTKAKREHYLKSLEIIYGMGSLA